MSKEISPGASIVTKCAEIPKNWSTLSGDRSPLKVTFKSKIKKYLFLVAFCWAGLNKKLIYQAFF